MNAFRLTASAMLALFSAQLSASPKPAAQPGTATHSPMPAVRHDSEPRIGANWSDGERMPDFFSGVWQSASPPFDGPTTVEYTDQAKAYIKQYKPPRDIPLAGANCKPSGLPGMQRTGSPLKFTFAPGMISIYIEQSSMTRFIYLNAGHLTDPDPTFLGESIGHFEGDTLVIDTIGFRDDTVFQYGTVAPDSTAASSSGAFLAGVVLGPHGPNLRIVERMRLLDADTLEIKLTVYDDSVFKTPYEAQPVQLFKRIRDEAGRPGEFVCETAIATPYDPETNTVTSKEPEETLREMGIDIK